jgi:hypothetical protein
MAGSDSQWCIITASLEQERHRNGGIHSAGPPIVVVLSPNLRIPSIVELIWIEYDKNHKLISMMSKYSTLMCIIVLVTAAIVNTQFCNIFNMNILDPYGNELFLKRIGADN